MQFNPPLKESPLPEDEEPAGEEEPDVVDVEDPLLADNDVDVAPLVVAPPLEYTVIVAAPTAPVAGFAYV